MLFSREHRSAHADGLLSLEQRSALYKTFTQTMRTLQRRGGSHLGDHMEGRYPGAFCPRDGAPMLTATIGGRERPTGARSTSPSAVQQSVQPGRFVRSMTSCSSTPSPTSSPHVARTTCCTWMLAYSRDQGYSGRAVRRSTIALPCQRPCAYCGWLYPAPRIWNRRSGVRVITESPIVRTA